MKMGNIVHRAGVESTSLAFWVTVLPLHDVCYPMSPLHPHLPDYAAPCLPQRSVQTTILVHLGMVSFLMLTFTYTWQAQQPYNVAVSMPGSEIMFWKRTFHKDVNIYTYICEKLFTETQLFNLALALQAHFLECRLTRFGKKNSLIIQVEGDNKGSRTMAVVSY